MAEHTFPSGDFAVDDGYATVRVAEMAEMLLEEIARPRHDWPALSGRSAELHEVARTMAERYGGARHGGER